MLTSLSVFMFVAVAVFQSPLGVSLFSRCFFVLSMCLDVSRCVTMCLDASRCVSMCLDVSRCVTMCLDVSRCVTMCLSMFPCSLSVSLCLSRCLGASLGISLGIFSVPPQVPPCVFLRRWSIATPWERNERRPGRPSFWVAVREVFIIHVGGTRCVPSSTANNMKIHVRITLTVECIRTCIVLFLFDVEIQLRVGSRLTFFSILLSGTSAFWRG
jgi:hypothetical protein